MEGYLNGLDKRSVDAEAPHSFLERMIVPFDAPERWVLEEQAARNSHSTRTLEQCAICRKVRTDPVHAASELAADEEHWPV
jgi:hypothetical protein